MGKQDRFTDEFKRDRSRRLLIGVTLINFDQPIGASRFCKHCFCHSPSVKCYRGPSRRGEVRPELQLA